MTRVLGVAAMIEAGRFYLSADASWLADFQAELLGFPNSRFDDQVDALSQLLDWLRQQDSVPEITFAAPIIYWVDEDGISRNSEDDPFDGYGEGGDDPFFSIPRLARLHPKPGRPLCYQLS